jgi:hypothetical protein
LYDATNKKVVGKMKIETSSLQITEFCGIRSKCYSYILDKHELKQYNDNTEDKMKEQNKKCKGVKVATVSKDIDHDDYKKAIFDLQIKTVDYNTIQSKKHNISSVNINKIAICPYDDKRLLRNDYINTYAIGHYKTRDNQNY